MTRGGNCQRAGFDALIQSKPCACPRRLAWLIDYDRTEHHFYVEEATKRASWVHPYDDPIFLQSLPESHPANPNSEQAKAMRQRADEERKVMEKARTEAKRDSSEQNLSPTSAAKRAAGSGVVSSDESRNWFQKQKDKLIGTKEERQKAKEERHRIQAEERKRARVRGYFPGEGMGQVRTK